MIQLLKEFKSGLSITVTNFNPEYQNLPHGLGKWDKSIFKKGLGLLQSCLGKLLILKDYQLYTMSLGITFASIS